MGRPVNKEHPRNSASFLSVIFYIFTFDTFRRGYKRQWTSDNLYKTIDDVKSNDLGHQIEKRWNHEKVKSSKRNKNPSLLLTLLKMFWRELLFAAVLLAIAQIILRLAEPILLGRLLKYFKEEDSITKSEALNYGILISAVIGARIVFYNQYKMRTYRTVLRIRVACSTLVYRKVLNLSLTSLQQTTSGQIVNFISYDLNRFDSGADLVHFVWVAPLFVLSIVYILYIETGLAGLIGVMWFSFVAILQSYNGNLTASIYGRMNRKSGNRLRIMNEIIAGIQVIKMYAWEKYFEKLVHIARREELKVLKKLNYVRNIFLSFSSICNHLALFLTLWVVISMKENITSAKVYGLVVYYGVLNFIVSIMFILGISKSVEILRTIKRLNEFLLREEYVHIQSLDSSDDNIVHLDNVEARWNSFSSLQSNVGKYQRKNVVSINDMHFSEKDSLLNRMKSRTVLQNINMALKKGNLIGIVGPVGSGKSSLLQTILGELELTSGTMRVQNSVSYASQDAWTFAGTVRENILFGQALDENRYREVVRVCCLERDFELFPNGDLTIVGDRGASLSGGQKSRINLARAIYRQKNIYLLDDPLSAVDVQVAKHIYHECIEKFLNDKCRILVTHHMHHLRTSDYIIVLHQGSIQDSGTYSELLCRNTIVKNNGTLDRNSSVNSDTDSSVLEEEDICDNVGEVVAKRDKPLMKLEELNENISAEHNDCKKHKTFLLLKYFAKDVNWYFFIFIFFLFSLIQTLLSSTDMFVSSWVNFEEHKNASGRKEAMKTFHISFPILETRLYLYAYGSLIALIGMCNLLRSVLFVNFFTGNSRRLHDNMFAKVVRASMEFFDSTSSGQILNRFSKDMQANDEFLPRTIMEALMFVNTLLAAIIIVILLNPYIIVMVALMSVLFISISFFFMRTSRNIKEVESSLMSPIISHLNETMQGLITIRGLGAQNIAQEKFGQSLDKYTSSWYMMAVAFAAFGFYIEFVSFLFISVVTLSLIAVGKDIGLTASEVGLAVTQSIVLSAIVQYGVLNCAQINNLLVSINRILEYNSIPQEDETKRAKVPPPNWPDKGEINFENVCLRYSISKPPVLKSLTFRIEPSEKVGIVGRTGAGKSSLISALFLLAKISGKIEIDGIDTNDIPLQALRSKISIIPQDPVLFNGTLRYNLDPFNEHDDHVLYEALKVVELNSSSNHVKKLSARVRDRGANYSVGQRQLICLARAIIRKNRIVILDEATANVDSQTDLAIELTMKKQFSDCTVLTVAHRLSTVMNSDKILVMDAGELVQIGHPYVLLSDVTGRFYSMVSQTGSSMAEHLKNMAFKNYEQKLMRKTSSVNDKD